jgi:hypothetical protein
VDADVAIATVVDWLDRTELEAARARTENTAREYHAAPPSAMSPAPASERTCCWRTALHEASHGVGAVHQGVRLRRVVLREGLSAVELVEEPEGGALAISQLCAPVLELLAGVGARRRCELASSFDVQAARVALSRCPEVSHRTAVTMAAAIVISKLSAIERVARALLALGELDGREVAALSEHAQ